MKSKRVLEKNPYHLKKANAILERKYILNQPDYTPKKIKFSSKIKMKSYKISNGKNMKCVYNYYPFEWCDPPIPWLSYKIRYKETPYLQ